MATCYKRWNRDYTISVMCSRTRKEMMRGTHESVEAFLTGWKKEGGRIGRTRWTKALVREMDRKKESEGSTHHG